MRRGSEKEELIRVELAGNGLARPVQVNRWNRYSVGLRDEQCLTHARDMVRTGLRAFYQREMGTG